MDKYSRKYYKTMYSNLVTLIEWVLEFVDSKKHNSCRLTEEDR